MGINNGGCAFPVPHCIGPNGDIMQYGEPGMTLRDHFASHAPITFKLVDNVLGGLSKTSLFPDADREMVFETWASLSYEYADGLSMDANPNSIAVRVNAEVKTKVPTLDRPTTYLFASGQGDLLRDDPFQPRLPGLQEVKFNQDTGEIINEETA